MTDESSSEASGKPETLEFTPFKAPTPTKLLVINEAFQYRVHQINAHLGPDWMVCTWGAMLGGRRFSLIMLTGGSGTPNQRMWAEDVVACRLIPGGAIFDL